jgi:hypothetical protein
MDIFEDKNLNETGFNLAGRGRVFYQKNANLLSDGHGRAPSGIFDRR